MPCRRQPLQATGWACALVLLAERFLPSPARPELRRRHWPARGSGRSSGGGCGHHDGGSPADGPIKARHEASCHGRSWYNRSVRYMPAAPPTPPAAPAAPAPLAASIISARFCGARKRPATTSPQVNDGASLPSEPHRLSGCHACGRAAGWYLPWSHWFMYPGCQGPVGAGACRRR